MRPASGAVVVFNMEEQQLRKGLMWLGRCCTVHPVHIGSEMGGARLPQHWLLPLPEQLCRSSSALHNAHLGHSPHHGLHGHTAHTRRGGAARDACGGRMTLHRGQDSC